MWVAAGSSLALLIAVSWRYGYHRDELYFLEAGRHHLALGFVDQPPISPALAALGDAVLGASPAAIRVIPALAMAATVVLTALTCKEMGGNRTTQIIAAVAAATVPEWLGAAHLMSTTPIDVVFWAALIYLFVRIVARGETRLWLLAGLVAGVGLENKWNVLFLAGSVGVGMILNRQRSLILNRWFAGGAAIALAIWLPNLIWQSAHGWPSIEMLGNLHDENVDDGVQATFVPAQILYVGPFLLPVWIAGLIRLFRNPDARPFRALAIAYPILFAWFLLSAGKPYYLSGLYVGLLAAGAIAVAGWIERGGMRFVRTPRAVIALILLGAVPGIVISLPVLSEQQVADAGLVDVNYDLGEQIAWPEMVDQVASAYRDSGVAAASDPLILTGNYGEAGAIDRYGSSDGLPGAYSGQNSYSDWGPPPFERSGKVLGVGLPVAYGERFFRSCSLEGRLDNGLGIDNDEQGEPIISCSGQRLPWPELWPKLRHYG